MSREKLLAEHLTIYRDCVLVPMLYTDTQDGEKIQGYGFITIYTGLNLSAHCCRPDQWLTSAEAALEIGKTQIDLDVLKLKHCIVEYLK